MKNFDPSFPVSEAKRAGLAPQWAFVDRTETRSPSVQVASDLCMTTTPAPTSRIAEYFYVDQRRLEELKAAQSNDWDLKRLIRMCEELNSSYEGGSYIACSMLLRSIVDHVPPIFGYKSFAEVASNYAGSKSFRASMSHLDRSLRTDAGRSYIEACKRIIEQVDEAEREVSGEYRVPKGDLAATAPWGVGHMHLLPIAVEFLAAHPEIALRLVLTDRVVDTVKENIDVAIRIGILPDSSMIAARIASIRVVVCASPAYLAERGSPKNLDDLSYHNCITVDEHATPPSWRFVKDHRQVVTPIRSRLCVSTSEAAIQAAIAGAGLARVMSYKMAAAKRAGALEILLDAFEQEPLPVHIVYAHRTLVPLKLRTFLNWVTPRLKARLIPHLD